MIKKIFSKDNDSHEFKPILGEIESSPVNPIGRTMFWIIISVIAFFGIWLYLGKVDIVVSSRGKIVPYGEIKTLQPLETGIIRHIGCKPGDYVELGQVLVEIDPSTIEPSLVSFNNKLKQSEIEVERLRAILNGGIFSPDSSKYDPLLLDTQIELYHASLSAMEKLIEAKQNEAASTDAQIKTESAEIAKAKSLLLVSIQKEKRLKAVIDIVSSETYEQAKNEIINYENSVKVSEFKIKGLNHRKQQLLEEIEYQKQNFRQTNLQELVEKQKQLNDFRAEIDRMTFLNKKQRIVSPVRGYINEVFITTIGGVVTPAQKLISIVPAELPLIIEALILNQDIGFVSEGMSAVIKIDTYPFQKYGMLNGTVKHISKDSIIDEKLGPIYKAYITPIEKSLIIDGKKTSITTGLTVTAEVKTGKRRIIEFFIYPLIKYLNEGMSVR
ncbi:MAG: HlyD family type I secretion periplasmic adaptor subunit [Desulfobacterales bacterium]|nr:HlyD family type I secretion periplasmic adaptor subunit [Desulfobacterales bacterium]